MITNPGYDDRQRDVAPGHARRMDDAFVHEQLASAETKMEDEKQYREKPTTPETSYGGKSRSEGVRFRAEETETGHGGFGHGRIGALPETIWRMESEPMPQTRHVIPAKAVPEGTTMIVPRGNGS